MASVCPIYSWYFVCRHLVHDGRDAARGCDELFIGSEVFPHPFTSNVSVFWFELGVEVGERARNDLTILRDDAAAHGLQCWLWLGTLTNLAAGADDSSLRRVVEALRHHPALGAWKGHDEPRNPFNPAISVPPENLARGHRAVAALDPDHPLVIIQAPRGSVDGLVPYRPAFDIGG